jgi:hypothetical protein
VAAEERHPRIGALLFPFHIEPDARFDQYARNVRAYVDQIVDVLRNPCIGQRLRHPPEAAETKWRWDDFCKRDLPRRLRLVYIWDPDAAFITIVRFGPHLGHGEFGDVYDGLAARFRLTDDQGHAQLATEMCCAGTDESQRTVSVDEGRDRVLRMARR